MATGAMGNVRLERAVIKDGKIVEKSEAELARERALAALDAVAGEQVSDEDLLWQGDKIVLPKSMEGDYQVAIDTLQQRMDAEEEEFSFERTYNYRPYDGAAAFQRAVIRTLGVNPAGKSTYDMFGRHRPRYMSVASGPHTTIQIPWGTFKLALLEAEFELGATRQDGGVVFELTVNSKQKHRRRIDALLNVIEDELEKRSIYRGKALSGDDGIQLRFFDPKTLSPEKIVYTQTVLDQLDANVWVPIEHSGILRAHGQSLRRAVLLEGPNGTGKTSAGVLTAQRAVENGWTFIRVQKGEDPQQALSAARQYAPAVVWYEDIDDMVSGQTRANVSKFMDVLDNVQSKNAEVIAVFTSNFVEKIEKGVMRPGRIDAVIHIEDLDEAATQKLIEILVPEGMLAANIDWARVYKACEGFLPAFLSEATGRAVRYALARNIRSNARELKVIGTEDLVLAAESLQPQLELMGRAKSTAHEAPDHLEHALSELVGNVVEQKLDEKF